MIHKEGIKISLLVFIILALLNTPLFLWSESLMPAWILLICSFGFMVFILRFFRNPHRNPSSGMDRVFSPADGKVVVVEETTENEYFKDNRIQISIFMSVWNVHINWYPLAGNISYYKYHPGKFLLARHPKSSTLNERNTVVVRTESGREILIRQIAGVVARRIISYAEVENKVTAGDEMGFIRFGSRVDVFLPPGSKIHVKPGEKVRGLKSLLADLA